MTEHWPFPGDTSPPPVYDLPPPRYSTGDRVESRWGSATVIRWLPWPGADDSRMYMVKADWSTSPEGFGNPFSELGLKPLIEAPRPAPVTVRANSPAQDDLFEVPA